MRLRPLLMLAALSVGAPAEAEDWWFTGPASDQIGLIDADSIAGAGDSRTAMIRGYAKSGPAIIAGAQVEADCANRRMRRLRVFVYSLTLELMEEVPPSPEWREWQDFGPTEAGGVMIRFICGWRPEGDFPTRIGRLHGGRHDKDIVFVLIDLNIPVHLAVQFGLGDLSLERAESLLRGAPPEAASILRRSGFPRPPAAR